MLFIQTLCSTKVGYFGRKAVGGAKPRLSRRLVRRSLGESGSAKAEQRRTKPTVTYLLGEHCDPPKNY